MKVKFPPLSELFHEAADYWLYHPTDGGTANPVFPGEVKGLYLRSCDALSMVIIIYITREEIGALRQYTSQVRSFLIELGLNPLLPEQFFRRAYEGGPLLTAEESQEYRYSWLKFCAMIAEERGI